VHGARRCQCPAWRGTTARKGAPPARGGFSRGAAPVDRIAEVDRMSRIVPLAAAVALAACAARAPARTADRAREPEVLAEACPILVTDTRVVATELSGGCGLTFVAPTARHARDVRRRVHELGAVFARASAHPAWNLAWIDPRAASARMPRSRAHVIDLGLGARIELRALDSRQIHRLREEVREYAAALRRGSCPLPS
jgi:hypothetical protein